MGQDTDKRDRDTDLHDAWDRVRTIEVRDTDLHDKWAGYGQELRDRDLHDSWDRIRTREVSDTDLHDT
jgi:hypothetical protein